MPRIQPIIADIAATGGIPGRQATGADFGAGIGAAVANVGEDVQRLGVFLEEKQTQDDVANVRMAMAKARADWSKQYAERKAKADPSDTMFADTFAKDMADYLDKGRDVATTRQGQRTYDMLATEMRGRFAEQAIVFQSSLAGVKAVNDFNSAANMYGSSLLTDPTQYGQVLAQAMSDINDPNGRYAGIPAKDRGELAIKLKDTLAKSYVQGLIANGAGELAKNVLMSGRLDSELNPTDKNSLIGQADTAVRSASIAAEHARVVAEKQRKETQDSTQLSFIQRIIAPSKENGGMPSARDIAAASMNGGLRPDQVTELNSLIFSQARNIRERTENRPNPQEETRLTLQLYANPEDPDKSYTIEPSVAAFAAGKINAAEFDRMVRRVGSLKDGATNSFSQDFNRRVNEVGRTISAAPQYLYQPERVIEVMGRMRADAEALAEKYRKEGKNPRDLLNPENKESPFSAARVATYLGSSRAAIAEEAQAIVAKEAARDPSRAAAGTIGGGATPPPAPKLPTYKEFDKLKKGERFTDPQGNVRVKP